MANDAEFKRKGNVRHKINIDYNSTAIIRFKHKLLELQIFAKIDVANQLFVGIVVLCVFDSVCRLKRKRQNVPSY